MRKIRIYLTILTIFLVIFFVINFITGYFSKRVSVYVNNKATIYSTKVLEEAIRLEVVDKLDLDSLVYLNKNSQEVVTSVYINTSQVNKIMSGVSKSLVKNLEKIEQQSLILPLGIIISETLFYNWGPNINIRIIPVGSVVTDVVSKVSEYGINSSLLEISISVKIKIDTIVPFKKGTTEVNFNVPLVMQVLNSDVPRYYFNGSGVVPFVNNE
jgi:sporulation protein YunB